jgi:hypothetical protein
MSNLANEGKLQHGKNLSLPGAEPLSIGDEKATTGNNFYYDSLKGFHVKDGGKPCLSSQDHCSKEK